MTVQIVAVWLVEDRRELTLTLERHDGQRVYVVVPIDRLTEWIPKEPKA